MSEAHANSTQAGHGGPRHRGDLAFGAIAAAAYVAFGAFAFLHDGSRGSADAPLPDDAAALATASGEAPTAGAEDAARMASLADKPERATTRSIGAALERARDRADGDAETVETPNGTEFGSTSSGSDGAVETARSNTTTRSLGAGVERASSLTNDPSEVRSGDEPIGNLNMQFLVKFEPSEAERWLERYRANPEETRVAFEEFARRNPAFAGLRLVSMNYSGLCTLEFTGEPPPIAAAREALSADIVARIGAAEHVEYIEPNLVGWRETSEP